MSTAVQVEAMLDSLEEGGAPEEQIAHFRESKKAEARIHSTEGPNYLTRQLPLSHTKSE